LTSVFEDEQLFHAVRVAAVDALLAAPSKRAAISADRVAEHVLALYRERWFHPPSHELRAYPLPHDFADFADYRTKIGTVEALCRARDPEGGGRTPPSVVDFVLRVLEYHDTASRTYSDVFFTERVMRALGHLAFVPQPEIATPAAAAAAAASAATTATTGTSTFSSAAGDTDPDRTSLRDAPGEEILWSVSAKHPAQRAGGAVDRRKRSRPHQSGDGGHGGGGGGGGGAGDEGRKGVRTGNGDGGGGDPGVRKRARPAHIGGSAPSTASQTVSRSWDLGDVRNELVRRLEYDAVVPSHQRRIACAALQALAELELRHDVRRGGAIDYARYAEMQQPGSVRVAAFGSMLSLLAVRPEYLVELVACVERERGRPTGTQMASHWAETLEARRPSPRGATEEAAGVVVAVVAARLWRLVADAHAASAPTYAGARFCRAMLRVVTAYCAQTVRPIPSSGPATSATRARRQEAHVALARRRACRKLELATSASPTPAAAPAIVVPTRPQRPIRR